MRREILQKVEDFIKTEIFKSVNDEDITPRKAEYRIEHSYRVAHIAKEIALQEGFDAERAYVAGLLHDVGYSKHYNTHEDFIHHGRIGAEIARGFLQGLHCYSEEEINEICFGIAIHVDDKSDFDGERTPLAVTVGDADNIDRFDAFRLYEGLQDCDYKNMPLSEQEERVNKVLAKLEKLKDIPFGTQTATKLWQEKIAFQTEFYQHLKHQVEYSKYNES